MKKNISDFIADAMSSILDSKPHQTLFNQPYKQIFAAESSYKVDKRRVGRHAGGTGTMHPARMSSPEVQTPHPESVYPAYKSKITSKVPVELQIAKDLLSGKYDTGQHMEYVHKSTPREYAPDPDLDIPSEIEVSDMPGPVEPEYQSLVYTDPTLQELVPEAPMFPHEYAEQDINEELLKNKLNEFKKMLSKRKEIRQKRDDRKKLISGKITNPNLLEKILKTDKLYDNYKHLVRKLSVEIQKFKEKSGFYNILDRAERVYDSTKTYDWFAYQAENVEPVSSAPEEIVSLPEEQEEEEVVSAPVLTGKELSALDKKVGGFQINDEVVYTKEDGTQCPASIKEINRDGDLKFIRIEYTDTDNQKKYKIITSNSTSITLEE